MNRHRHFRQAVITGIGVLAPNGADVATFWNSVRDGQSAADFITQFDTRDSRHRIGAEIPPFDYAPFMDAKKARRYDKCIKYGVVAATLALRDAGIDVRRVDPERRGVVEGTTVGGIDSLFRGHLDYHERGPEKLNPIHVINSFVGEGSSAIALELEMKANSSTICSGCCSSNDAIGYATQLVQWDDADVMIAGGADANLLAPMWAGFEALGVMTQRRKDPKSAMRPFDRHRDGFILSEGAVFLVIEEMTHALERGARIYAEVLGHGRSCEAYHVVDLQPDGEGIARAIGKALRNARIAPDEVDYINVHGTATPMNDPIESKAIRRFFGPHADRLAVTATKPVTGHMMGASGAAETAICALSLYHQVIPPTINLREPDDGCDLDYVPNRHRPYPIKIALNLNSGFGGKNACLVLGNHPSSGA